MKIAIISTSLNPQSKSRILAQSVQKNLLNQKIELLFVDLQEWDLPFCDGGSAYSHSKVIELQEKLQNVNGFIFAVPIYNFEVNSAFKNFVELFGSTLENKVAGFLCAAGGNSSYMSVMSIANGLMLDFRTLILPRFVYATSQHFDAQDQPSPEIIERLQQFTDEFSNLVNALQN